MWYLILFPQTNKQTNEETKYEYYNIFKYFRGHVKNALHYEEARPC